MSLRRAVLEMSIFSIVLVLLILIAAWLVWTYNRFIRHKNNVREAWSGIDVQLKRRHNLIPNVIDTVKGYLGHEQGTLDSLTRLRTGADDGAAFHRLRSMKAIFPERLAVSWQSQKDIRTSRPIPDFSIFSRNCTRQRNRYNWQDATTTAPSATGMSWWSRFRVI